MLAANSRHIVDGNGQINSTLSSLLWEFTLPLHRECRGSLLTRKPYLHPGPAHAWKATAGAHRYVRGSPIQYASSSPGAESQAGLCKQIETTSPSSTISDWGFCTDGWRPQLGRCLVISIGIGGVLYFEEAMAGLGCDVHAFDPTSELREKHERIVRKWGSEQATNAGRIHFHFAGLGTETLEKTPYGTLGGPVFELRKLLRLANVSQNQVIDILKLDCEGCEWGAFKQLQRHDAALLGRVRQLLVELHFGSSTMIPPTRAALHAFLDHVVQDHRFRTFKWTPNGGNVPKPINFTDPILRELALSPQLCCYELHMHRVPGRTVLSSESHAPPFMPRTRPGFCAVTGGFPSWEKAAAYCTSENVSEVIFALPWAAEMKNLSRCVDACVHMCGPKCQFVSHSLQMQDCSVYSRHKCDMDLLHPSPHGKPDMLMGSDYITQQVSATTQRESASSPQDPERVAGTGAVASSRHLPLHGMCKHDFAIHSGYRFDSRSA